MKLRALSRELCSRAYYYGLFQCFAIYVLSLWGIEQGQEEGPVQENESLYHICNSKDSRQKEFEHIGCKIQSLKLLCKIYQPQDHSLGFSISFILDGLDKKQFLSSETLRMHLSMETNVKKRKREKVNIQNHSIAPNPNNIYFKYLGSESISQL